MRKVFQAQKENMPLFEAGSIDQSQQKQNRLSASNGYENQSLLVSSVGFFEEAECSKVQHPQKKFNRVPVREKQRRESQATQGALNCKDEQATHHECHQLIALLSEEVSASKAKISELESMVKILFSNKISSDSENLRVSEEVRAVKSYVLQSMKDVKENFDASTRIQVGLAHVNQQFKCELTQLKQQAESRYRELSEMLELEGKLKQQALDRLKTDFSSKLEVVVESMQQLSQNQHNLRKGSREESFSEENFSLPRHPRSKSTLCSSTRPPRNSEGGKQQGPFPRKSKVSYYLEKSCFEKDCNDTGSSLGNQTAASIDHMSRII